MRRVKFIAVAAPVGLATGLVAWLLAGGPGAALAHIDPVAAEIRAVHVRQPTSMPASDAGAAALIGRPLFALTTGPGAVREPAVRVDGLSLSGGRTAALMAIDGKPSAWMLPGMTVDGVTLQGVTTTGVTVETLLGVKTVALGEQAAASAPERQPGDVRSQAASPPDAHGAVVAPMVRPGVVDQVPRGFRAPPEPASAPGMAR